MKKVKHKIHRAIYKLGRSPEHYNEKFKTGKRKKEISEYESGIVVFDDTLDFNKKQTDPFCTKGRRDSDVYQFSRSFNELPKRSEGKNSNIINLFKQTLKDVDYIYRDIAAVGLSYDELIDVREEARTDKD